MRTSWHNVHTYLRIYAVTGEIAYKMAGVAVFPGAAATLIFTAIQPRKFRLQGFFGHFCTFSKGTSQYVEIPRLHCYAPPLTCGDQVASCHRTLTFNPVLDILLMAVQLSTHAALVRLIGSPRADFAERNQRLRAILKSMPVEFAPPEDDGSNHDLKGTASLCANLAFATLLDLKLLADAAFGGRDNLIRSLEVICDRNGEIAFPFFVKSKQAKAFQTRLAMHRPEKGLGDPYRVSYTGRTSFYLFWESLFADIVLKQAPLMHEEVIYELKKQGFSPNPLMVRAGLHLALVSLLKEQEPSGPVAEIWFACGLDGIAVKKIVANWAAGVAA